jgi:hypothetical protein
MKERKHERKKYENDIHLSLDKGFLTGQTKDICSGGLSFETYNNKIAVGKVYVGTIDNVKFAIRVIWISKNGLSYRVGCETDGVSFEWYKLLGQISSATN